MVKKKQTGNDESENIDIIDTNIDARLEHHWPADEVAKLEHQFKMKGPCPVKVGFDESQANVIVSTEPKRPLNVDMNHQFIMDGPCPVKVTFDEAPANVIVSTDPKKPLIVDLNLRTTEPIRHTVCVKVCEPICAKSDYAVGIALRERPIAQISIKGMTRIFNCAGAQDDTRTCLNFKRYKEGTSTETEFVIQGVTFKPLGDALRMVGTGEPAGEVKLGFTSEGVRIEFPSAVHGIWITVNDYADPELKFIVYSGGAVLSTFTEHVQNTVKQVQIDNTGVTAVEIIGGNNEASIVEVCYITDPVSTPSLTHRISVRDLS